MLKFGGGALENLHRRCRTNAYEMYAILTKWCGSYSKKVDTSNIKSYCPIHLLSQLYKLLSRIICDRLTRTLDFYQPVEEAGAVHTLGTLIENQRVQHLYLSSSVSRLSKSLENARIDSRYSAILKEIYENATLHVKNEEGLNTDKIKLVRQVRQGEPISPKLFTTSLEDVFKNLKRY